MVFELILALNQDDPAIVREFLLRYQPDIAGNIAYYDQLIEDALTYYREVVLPVRKVEEPGHAFDEALAALRDELARAKGMPGTLDVDALQTAAFGVMKERGIKPKEWFQTLYRLFLGQSQGPRIGTLIALLGLDKTIERLENHLGRS
jgi:lysyl-tRNA synthetase class 1